MLKIKTKIGVSNIHGIGLFADQFIPQGTITWIYEPEFDSSFSQEQINKLDDINQEYLLWFCYFDFKQNKYVLPSDNLRFINHSQVKINIDSTPDQDVALRDILAGEELLCNYNNFDKKYWERHNIIPLE